MKITKQNDKQKIEYKHVNNTGNEQKNDAQKGELKRQKSIKRKINR